VAHLRRPLCLEIRIPLEPSQSSFLLHSFHTLTRWAMIRISNGAFRRAFPTRLSFFKASIAPLPSPLYEVEVPSKFFLSPPLLECSAEPSISPPRPSGSTPPLVRSLPLACLVAPGLSGTGPHRKIPLSIYSFSLQSPTLTPLLFFQFSRVNARFRDGFTSQNYMSVPSIHL